MEVQTLESIQDRTFPVIIRATYGSTIATDPAFPSHCPCCNARKVAHVRGPVLWQQWLHYACGGKYKPHQPRNEKENLNSWSGICGSLLFR